MPAQHKRRSAGPDRGSLMEGHGYYNEHSRPQQGLASLGLPLLARAAEAVPHAEGPVVVADYGCAGGRNSIAPVRTAIERIRQSTSDAVAVVHTDLPGNDFTALLELLATSPDSYLQGAENVFAFAA